MELAAYSVYFLIAMFFTLKRRTIHNSVLFFWLWFTSSISLSIIVRNSGFDIDTQNYANAMKDEYLSVYILKEPVIWLGLRYIYQLFKNEIVAFFIMDAISFILIYKSLKNFGANQFLYFAFILFFPVVLGMQNIYRQYFAMIFVLLAISQLWNYKKIGWLTYILAILSHNVSALFLPLLVCRAKRFAKTKIIIASVLAIAGMAYVGDTKSSAETGANLTMLYIAVLLALIFTNFIAYRFIISKENKAFLAIVGLMLMLCGAASFATGSAGVERIAMFSLVLVYPILAILIDEKFAPKFLARQILVVFSFAPIFMSSNTAGFLIGW